MKNVLIAVLVAGALALSASGSTLAAGKMGGSAGGIDAFTSVCPALTAGKIGGASGGIDGLRNLALVESEGGKLGGGMDRCDQSLPSLASL
jgi:hypothetical protein